MTKSEYQELVEFIAPQFDRIGKRFDAVDERLRRVEILGEDNRHQIQIVAESVTGVGQRLDAFRSEVAAEFQEVRERIEISHPDLDRRVVILENRPNT